MDGITGLIEAQERILSFADTIANVQTNLESFGKTIEQVTRLTEGFSKTIESYNHMFEQIAEVRMEAISRFSDALDFKSPYVVTRLEAIDAEIIEEPKKLVALPQQTSIIVPALPLPRVRSKMGLKKISGGNFKYKDKTLDRISLSNREGEVLDLMLDNSDLFISDETMEEKFYVVDTFGRSKLIQLLKDKFDLNGLKAIIKRQGSGYILLSIHYLQ